VFQIKSKHGECNYCHATRHALQYNCQKVINSVQHSRSKCSKQWAQWLKWLFMTSFLR